MSTPCTVFTGFLGSGKTTIILSLIKQLPKNYKVCLLKNEFGDLKGQDHATARLITVDSELAMESNIEGVQEMLNGCLCCTLVGRMSDALLELKEKYNPARIIVETSGSAFPAPIAIQIRQLTRDDKGVHLDSIITVIDCINFRGYEDTSYTAKLQAKYTDLIVMNKHHLVSAREYDECLDHVYTLNENTPVIKTYERENVAVDPDLVFGLDTRLFEELKDKCMIDGYVDGHQSDEVDLIHLESAADESITRERLESILTTCPKEDIYRIKGFVKIEGEGLSILNFAFGRWEITRLTRDVKEGDRGLRLTVMLARGEGRLWHKEFSKAFKNENVHVDYYPTI